MYKKQMKLQKVVCFLAIAAAAVMFIYTLGLMTDLYDCLYSTMRNPNDHTKTSVPGSILYYDMQDFNSVFLKYSIIMIILAVLLFVTNTNIRRRYYVSNYVATGLYVVFAVFSCVWAHVNIQMYRSQWLAIDFAALKSHSEIWKSAYTESTFWFDAHYLVALLSLVTSGLLVYNLILKINLMKEEKSLIDAGEGAVK